MLRAFLALSIALAICRPLCAQAGFGVPTYDHYAVSATPEEVRILARDAHLDDATRDAALSLVSGCQKTLQRDQRRMQREWEKTYLNHPFEDRAAITDIGRALDAERLKAHDAATAKLLSDLHSLIPEQQSEAWSSFERRRHRRLYLNMSTRMGVTVDLVSAAEQAKVADLPEVAEVLAPYERELDTMLVARFPIALTYDSDLEAATGKGDEREAEPLYNAMRDADCPILHLQRETARKLLAAVPEDRRGQLRDLILVGRCDIIQTKPPVRMRAEKLLASGRIKGEGKTLLERAIRDFDDRSRPTDEGYLTQAEDEECSFTYAQSRQPRDQTRSRAWINDGNRLQADLLAVIEKVATEEDLDAIEDR